MSHQPRRILFIGFRNYLGRHFVEHLLEQDPQATIHLLIREDRKKQALRSIEAIHTSLDLKLGKGNYTPISIYVGDAVSIDLGLSSRDLSEVLAKVTEVYHFGLASVAFSASKGLINLRQSVHNLLDAALEMASLKRLNYLSSAFVSGDRQGVIMEDELDLGQSPRNEFERCALDAEKLIVAAMPSIPITIFRPSIIIGDTQTGEMDRDSNFFYVLSALLTMPSKFPVIVPYDPWHSVNVIPIDWACRVMAHLSTSSVGIGKTYHVTDSNPLSILRIVSLASQISERDLATQRIPVSLTRKLMDLPIISRLVRQQRRTMDQIEQAGYYNNYQLIQDLEGQFPCPPLPSYFEKMVLFARAPL